MLARKKMGAIALAVMIAIGSLVAVLLLSQPSDELHEISISEVLELTSTRNPIEDIVVTSDESPMLPLIATPAGCWYNIGGTDESSGDTDHDETRHGLKPLLISMDGELDTNHYRIIDYLDSQTAMVLGSVQSTGAEETFVAAGTPAQISVMVAEYVFASAAGALIIQDDQEGYNLGVVAAPIASYLNIPVIVTDSFTNYDSLRSNLRSLHVKYTIIIGDSASYIARQLGFKCILLETPAEINDNVLQVIRHRFGEINYITMTNPVDAAPPEIDEVAQEIMKGSVNNLKVQTGNLESDIVGESTQTFDITVPEGINRVQIYINFTKIESTPLDPIKNTIEVEPHIFAYLWGPSNQLIAFAPSFSYDVGKDYIETQTIDAPGTYTLEVDVYYGTKGFNTYAGTQFGISKIDAEYDVTVITSTQSTPHLSWYPKMSMMAAYLTASHGGIVLADPDFELTTEDYALEAEGYGTGPYYETGLHETVNRKVEYVVESLNQTVESLSTFDLKDGYLDGPAWLAVLAGPNMIPQHYEPKDPSWVEDVIYGVGWPTDIQYSMDLTLSNARILGRDIGDVSALIARTLFYEPYVESHTQMIKQEYGDSEDWKNNFHFLAGELGGRTGWFFWQREFASEVEDHGFQSEEYYQNYENDRQTMIAMGAYERANYFDLMMHGNWYWYVPEMNGVDEYSTSVKNSDLLKAPQDWELGPSIYNSGSCILGRIDGISPSQSLTFAFMHAGINAFFSSTRSTGSEAHAGTIERGLLYDDISVGEAIRRDKHENQEPAAYYVRMLFADPAFNPYEPENGFSDQGRPQLVTDQQASETRGTVTKTIPISKGLSSSECEDESCDIDLKFTQYFNYDTMTTELYNIANNHSEIAVLYSIGTTYEGRDIWAMKISDNPHEYEEEEPEVLFTGAHHGREWASYEVPLYLLYYLVDNYKCCPTDNDGDGLINEDVFDGEDNDGDGLIDEDEEEARISWLIDNRQIWFVPIVNPDGVSFAHSQREAGGLSDENLWRKNREPNKNPVTGEDYPEHLGGNDMWGTDLNRNYGFHWGELGYQGYADPSREDYIGPLDKTDEDNDRRVNEDKMDNIDNDGDGRIDEDTRGGFSTAETKAIKRLVEEHNFVIAMNFHTYGGKIYWPWVWTLELTPDEDLFAFLAERMSKFNGYEYRNMSERQQDQLSRHPPVDGDSNDWMYGKHKILAYTIEVGDQFILPEEEILPTCKMHVGPNLLMVEVADNPWQRKIGIEHEPLGNTSSTKGYTVKAVLNSPKKLELQSEGIKIYYSVDGENYDEIRMEATTEPNEFEARIPGQKPGTKISYYISVTDKNTHLSQLPKYAPYNDFNFRVIPARGQASASILWAHVIFIMGAIIFVAAAGYYGVRYLRKGYGINKVIQMSGIATGMIFVGGFPLGFLLAYQVYGTPWTGIPFGWDITDNKTLVIFLFWGISLFLVRGTTMNYFARGRGKHCPYRWLRSLIHRFEFKPRTKRRDTISHERFAKLAIIGAILTISLYLIPHSLMVSPAFSIFLFVFMIGIFIVPTNKK